MLTLPIPLCCMTSRIFTLRNRRPDRNTMSVRVRLTGSSSCSFAHEIRHRQPICQCAAVALQFAGSSLFLVALANLMKPRTSPMTAVLCFAILSTPTLVSAADAFRVGESVAFLHKQQWHVGTIVRIERGQAMVSAELDGEATQGVFAVAALRRPPWTVGSRFWSDQSGKFRIKASVVDVSAEALELLKSEGSTVTVPIDQLSDSDQAIAAKLVSAKQAYEASKAATPSGG